MQLNPQQQKVVNALTGPCLVIAGAGSGKTRVIINKIKNLLAHGVPDHGIYAVTFTNKAAKEMKERLKEELKDKNNVHISTFHTLGLEMIKAEHKLFKLKEKVILTDTHDQTVLLRDLLLNSHIESTLEEEIEQVRAFISKAKNDLYLPGDLPDDPESFSKRPDFIAHYQHYRKIYNYYFSYMQSISCLDFDDLILLPTMLLRFNSKVRAKYQKKIKYLLVDEYQDTNTSQYELVKLLVEAKPNFTVVGDDDQSIYSWRGAQPQNLNRLQSDFPNLEVYYLEQNYRSTETILEAANHLIANNNHVYEKSLRSANGSGKMINVYSHPDSETEAYHVIQQIIEHRANHKTKWSDYAILYRSNHQARLLEKECVSEEIPFIINGDSSFFDKSEIKDIIAYLRVLNNIEDDKSLMRIINVPRRGIGSKTIVSVGNVAKDLNCSFFEACKSTELQAQLRASSYKTLNDFVDFILEKELEINEYEGGFKAIQDFFTELEYETFLLQNADNPRAVEVQMKNVESLLEMIRRWMRPEEEGGDNLSLSEVCNKLFLREMYENRNKEAENEYLQMMTMHASKGLEFPYVHIVGCEEEIIPHRNSIEDENIEEERRLMYVGITRAQTELSLHYAMTRKSNGEYVEVEPSRFIGELPSHITNYNETKEEETLEIKKAKSKSIVKNIEARLMQRKNKG